MKKAILMIAMAAVIALTACAGGNEPVMESPEATASNAPATQTPEPTLNENTENTLPEGTFDRQFSGFWSETDGWFVGCDDIEGTLYSNRYIYRTSDGGKTWTESYHEDSYGSWPVTCAFFANENEGFLGFHYDFEHTGWVLRTEDGGKTWTELNIPSLSEIIGPYWQREPREIRAVNGSIELTYFVSTSYYGETGLLYTAVSEDMGKTWGAFTCSGDVKGNVPHGSFNREFIYFWTPDRGFYVGCKDAVGTVMSNHYIFLTDDGGKTWTETGNLNDSCTLPVTCAFFQDESLGFLGFHYDFEEAGKVFRTEDGGRTWTELAIPALSEITGYNWRSEPKEIRGLGDMLMLTYFVSTSDSGDAGLLYTSRSEDWGTTWEAFEQRPN